MSAETSRVKQLEALSQELESLNYYNSDAVKGRLQSIKDSFGNLQNLSDDRRERIQNGIAAQQKLDSMKLDFAKRAAVSLLLISFWGEKGRKWRQTLKSCELYLP